MADGNTVVSVLDVLVDADKRLAAGGPGAGSHCGGGGMTARGLAEQLLQHPGPEALFRWHAHIAERQQQVMRPLWR